MNNLTATIKNWFSKEATVTVLLWVLYFVVIAQQKDLLSDRTGEPGHLQIRDFVFTLNYLLVVLLINYWLLPRYFYRKHYFTFALLSIAILGGAILIEEFVMEQIYFSDSRGQGFSGFLPTLLDIGPTILFFVGFKLAWDNLKKQNALEQVQKEKVESQMQFLKSQLNPHFLFNNLNNLYSFAQEKSPKTPEIIMQLSAIMRYMLYESNDNLVSLEKELKYLEDFINLQELQMEGRGKVEFTIQGEAQGKMIAPMVLIAFVENCFKHSLSSQAEGIRIDIKAEVTGDQLHFKCSNTFTETGNTSGKYLSQGIGMENVQKRLELQYPDKYEFTTSIQDSVYHVDLRLTL
ncbi:MAG: sensor histidine kinase [Cyclobacteriaceae bacterium]